MVLSSRMKAYLPKEIYQHRFGQSQACAITYKSTWKCSCGGYVSKSPKEEECFDKHS
jgi:hypothetical protein